MGKTGQDKTSKRQDVDNGRFILSIIFSSPCLSIRDTGTKVSAGQEKPRDEVHFAQTRHMGGHQSPDITAHEVGHVEHSFAQSVLDSRAWWHSRQSHFPYCRYCRYTQTGSEVMT